MSRIFLNDCITGYRDFQAFSEGTLIESIRVFGMTLQNRSQY